MSRHLVRSFLLATALSPLVNAGPCRPHPTSASSVGESSTQTVSPSLASSSVILIDTETVSHSDMISEDAATGTGSSTLQDDTTVTFSEIYSASTATSEDATFISIETTAESSVTDTTAATQASTSSAATQAAPTDTTVNTHGSEASATATSDELTGTMTDAATSSAEATSDTTLTSSQTDTPTTGTSGDLTTTAETATFPSTTEATSTALETSTTTAAVCTPTLLSTPHEGAVCGKQGNPSSFTDFLLTLTEEEFTASIGKCYEACKDNTNCGSFIFMQGAFCELWKGEPTGLNNADTPYKWYSLDCFSCGPDETETNPPETNVPTQPEGVCVDNLLNPPPKDTICGATGSGAGDFMSLPGGGSTTSLDACRNDCENTENCDAIAFHQGAYCVLYSGHITETYGAPTAWKYYDMSCFCETEPSTPTEPEPNNPAEPEPTCKNNIINPIPDYRVCGQPGRAAGLYHEGPAPEGSTKSLLACAKACINGPCRAFRFEVDKECEFYVGTGLNTPDGTEQSYRWYQPECFCDLEEDEPSDPEITPAPEVTPTPEITPTPEAPTDDVCIGEPLDSLPKDTVCGKKGSVPAQYKSNERIKTAGTLAECYKACKAAGDCDLIEFLPSSTCKLYKIQGQFSDSAVQFTGSVIEWWQPSCFCDDEPKEEEPVPVCRGEPKNPLPTNTICDMKGLINSNFIGERGKPTAATPTECNKACKANSSCHLFKFTESGQCILYQKGYQFGPSAVESYINTDYKWWEPSCFCEPDVSQANPE
ncbi:uncharacterized protein FIESC28_06200 [Fusarium coffeatum]|uniref:Apple domain-containing protein n=1 Tax=Fusarium coffeatum TaxID=231269 RepID=A0A366RLX0_9HYPO|nr:uncharacterized protein FIESC28_06200 [Fusarium coffeatum]RBR18134.1 hypothetical protein FIESC28_06200 [Fusarium coffeatum]